MRIGVPRETAAGERRVALSPDTVARLKKTGIEFLVQARAGEAAFFSDEDYAAAGAAMVADPAEVYRQADLLLKVQKPSAEEVKLLRPKAAIAGLLQPAASENLLHLFAERRITAIAIELVPRIAAAQSMDALSSQATIAGYSAVLLGAASMNRLMPMMITAAGTYAPSKVFVIGAGVAGLQAIATARRLGGVVSAFDVRKAAKQEVQSLGATFLETEEAPKDAEVAGGYARELAEDERRRVAESLRRHLREMDLVITTALVPGRPAPRLITAEMVAAMKPGSVIVDIAAENGGNCELTRAGEVVEARGVTIHGPVNMPSSVPTQASQMYGRNLQSLIQYLVRDGRLAFDLADQITGPIVVAHQGEVLYPRSEVQPVSREVKASA
jgi:H+-translocating NAD(P) transhydrogenase subunit alpha